MLRAIRNNYERLQKLIDDDTLVLIEHFSEENRINGVDIAKAGRLLLSLTDHYVMDFILPMIY